MVKAMRYAIIMVLLTVNSLLAQAPTKSAPGKTTQGEPSKFTEIVKTLFSDWLVLLLFFGLIVLVGVFFYVRNRRGED